MKKFYIFILASFLFAILLFIASFFYVDRTGHKTYNYVIASHGRDIGSVKIDKFRTEDRIIYRAAADMPFAGIFTQEKIRIDMDKKRGLEQYSKEIYEGKAKELVYLENKKNNASMVAVFRSKFIFLGDLPLRKNTFIFEANNPLTYLPIIENYDFRKGRAQGFNGLIFLSMTAPPLKRFMSLTSIKDEHIKINSKKIKTENLILKIRSFPQVNVWIAKSDKSLVKIEIPETGMKITRRFSAVKIEAREKSAKSDEYRSKNVTLKSKNAQLAGTLTMPKTEGVFPAVLLICGAGPQGRDYQGFFSSIADYLSKNGFYVLRLDKRGTGLSTGDYSAVTDNSEVEDLSAAVDYLADLKGVDAQKIFVIGHAKGAFIALKLAAKKPAINKLVLMALSMPSEHDLSQPSSFIPPALKKSLNEEDMALLAKTAKDTRDKVMDAKYDWTDILGERCFVKKMREEMSENYGEVIGKVKVPVLILQGKIDDVTQPESASRLDEAFETAGNHNHAIVYYSYLGHFFGQKVNDGTHRIYYEIDKEVLDSIKNWLR